MGQIRVILFLLPLTVSLAICCCVPIVRQQWATAYAMYISNWLPYAQCTLTSTKYLMICYRMRSVCQQISMHILHQQISTVCTANACNLMPYAQFTLANCFRMRSVRLQRIKYFAILYARNWLPQSTEFQKKRKVLDKSARFGDSARFSGKRTILEKRTFCSRGIAFKNSKFCAQIGSVTYIHMLL